MKVSRSVLDDVEMRPLQKDKMYILVFEGVNGSKHRPIETQSSFSLRKQSLDSRNFDGSYPYRGLKECIGILWDSDLSCDHLNLFIEMQQEHR